MGDGDGMSNATPKKNQNRKPLIILLFGPVKTVNNNIEEEENKKGHRPNDAPAARLAVLSSPKIGFK